MSFSAEHLHGGNVRTNDIEYDFSASLNPLGIPPCIKKALMKSMAEAVFYPDPDQRAVRLAYSKKHGIPADNVIFGNGAAELIRISVKAVKALKKSKADFLTCVPLPCFHEYIAASENEGAVITHDHENADLIFISNPTSPGGEIIERDDIIEAVENNPASFFCIDESFLPFYTYEDRVSLINFTYKYSNLAVIRSFTKIFSIPGISLGALITSNRDLLYLIKKYLQPWNISSFAAAAAMSALSDESIDTFINKSRLLIAEERTYLEKELSVFSNNIFKSEVNYILFHIDEKNSEQSLYDKLLSRKISVRDCSNFEGLNKGWYRIAVRNHRENEVLIKAIKSCL